MNDNRHMSCDQKYIMSNNTFFFSCCFLLRLFSLSVLMEDDEEMLEFRASADDLVSGRSEKEVLESSSKYGVPVVPRPRSTLSVDAVAGL